MRAGGASPCSTAHLNLSGFTYPHILTYSCEGGGLTSLCVAARTARGSVVMDGSQTAAATLIPVLEATVAGRTTLSDGRQELAWASAPRAVSALAAFFAEQGITPQD